MLTIVDSFKYWRHYLEGSLYTIKILNDYTNLQSFIKQTKPNGRQVYQYIYLTLYNFVIKYRSKKKNPTDTLSRQPDYKEGEVLTLKYLSSFEQKFTAL